MKKQNILGLALLLAPLAVQAQSSVANSNASVQFETTDYTSIGVYDTWEESPFRTGDLTGNVAVVANPDTATDALLAAAPNPSAKVLAVQRSRFGSNTFGARIDLTTPFRLTTNKRYVHVMLLKPRAGRVMLVGLGKRIDRAGQSQETEQFWEVSTTTATVGKWSDMVFAINGANGIDIYSLVVVPDLESPHDLTEDFVAYIDNIELNDSYAPRVSYEDYPLNISKTQASEKANYYLNSIALNGSSDGNQTIAVGSQSPQVIYRDQLYQSFTAKKGERLTPVFNFNGSWMNGYVYLDRGSDGRFTKDLNSDYTIPDGSDIMTYSYVETVANTEGYKSDGTHVTGNARNILNPPAFTLPSDLSNGFYRMRFKVDWGSVDPGGSMTSGNTITHDGGMIVDVRLNVHGDSVLIKRDGGLNGDLVNEDGSDFISATAPFGQPFTVIAKPAPDFELSYIRVRHGYNLAGDSLIHGTPQYSEDIFPGYLFKNGKFTIPAEYIDGDVAITPEFKNPGITTGSGEDYPLNFTKDLTISRTDRALTKFVVTSTHGGSTEVSVSSSPKHVYQDRTAVMAKAKAGDAVHTSVTYQGRAMHIYLYVDLNEDGQFTPDLQANGKPTLLSELLSYTCYDGHNSYGASISAPGNVTVDSLPVFNIPQGMPEGVYRARLKIDWNNMDPGGHYNVADGNLISNNGGYVIDFLLSVYEDEYPLSIATTDGSIVRSLGTALPLSVTPFTALSVLPIPAAEGYTLPEGLRLKHGQNLDGPQYVHGNKQWGDTIFTDAMENEAFTIPQALVDGNVELTARFQRGDNAEYFPVFSDEFNEEGLDTKKWAYCAKGNSTWNKFLAQTEEERSVVNKLEGTHYAALCLPNADLGKSDAGMTSGGITTKDKFTFTYGKVEARVKTLPHTGNFPALWMMPEDNSLGWPNNGEMDIWEQIDDSNTSWGTVHTKWHNVLGNTTPAKSGSKTNTTKGLYHTVGFEWNDTQLVWYVDGEQVFTYDKATDNENALENGQWPFDNPFYLILNQSVGDGSWAKAYDANFRYETIFDWVRVYQKNGMTNSNGEVVGIRSAKQNISALGISTAKGLLRITSMERRPVSVYHVSGATVFQGSVEGCLQLPLPSGVYIVGKQKVLVP